MNEWMRIAVRLGEVPQTELALPFSICFFGLLETPRRSPRTFAGRLPYWQCGSVTLPLGRWLTARKSAHSQKNLPLGDVDVSYLVTLRQTAPIGPWSKIDTSEQNRVCLKEFVHHSIKWKTAVCQETYPGRYPHGGSGSIKLYCWSSNRSRSPSFNFLCLY